MSYYPMTGPAPAPSGPGERPTTVMAAVVCTLISVLLMLTSVALSIVILSSVTDNFDAAAGGYSSSAVDSVRTIFKITQVATIIFYLLISITMIALALGNMRGRNGTRIATWVVSGLFVLCGICGSISTASGFGTTSSGTDVYQMFDFPSWYKPVTLLTTTGLTVAQSLVIILLALPASNAFFRRQPAGTPGMQYPGAPGQDHPGYPQQGYPQGHPGGASYPGHPNDPQHPQQQPPGGYPQY